MRNKKELLSIEDYRHLSKKSVLAYGDSPNTTVITIENKVIKEEFWLSNTLSVVFNNCTFTENFNFYDYKPNADIWFSNCYFLKDISFFEFTSDYDLSFFSCIVKGSIVSNLNCGSRNLILDISCRNKIVMTAYKTNTFTIDNQKRNSITDLYLGDNAQKLSISNCDLGKVDLYYLASDREIEMFNCKINSLHISNLRNNGVLKISNCSALELKNKKSYLTINNSNLGKAEFVQFNFSSFFEVNILNSILTDCIFLNTTWSDNINSFAGEQMVDFEKDRIKKTGIAWNLAKKISLSLGKRINNYRETKLQVKNNKDNYRQIKYALSKQGDVINEQFFHGLEMNMYNKFLPFSLKNVSTKIILSLSYITSNYGQSLFRPFAFLFLINGIIFTFMVYKSKVPEIYFEYPTSYTLNGIGNTLGEFFRLLNPLHKNDPEFKGWRQVFDVIMRIVSSYSIYNLIRASRRFIN